MEESTQPRYSPGPGPLRTARDVFARVARGVNGLLGGEAAFFAIVALAMLVVCTLFEMNSRAFPYWDFAFYQNQTFAVADAFGRSFGEGYALVARSLNDDYNFLLTVPLVPLIWIFGETRLVYIFDIILVYFMPFVIVVAALARRIFPDRRREAGILAALMVVATPLTWENVLQGYADIGGATFIGAMVLCYGRSARGRDWRWLLGAGAFAAFAILFRRGYIYAAFAFYVAFGLDIVLAYARARVPKAMLRALAALAGSGVVMLLVVLLIARGFVQRILSPAYLHTFAPWEMQPAQVLTLMIALAGIPVLLIAVAGMFVPRRSGEEARSLSRVIAIASATWVVTWLVVVRQGPTHYPHVLPYLIAIGLTGAFLYCSALPGRTLRRASVAALSVLVAAGVFVAIPFSRPAFAVSAAVPPLLLPARMLPLVNPSYDEIMRLVLYMRQQAGPNDAIVVASGSSTFNYDLFREAERTLFGPANSRLQIPYVSQSTVSETPTETLLHAKYVLVAEPFQHHLRADDQKPVHVLVDIFEQKWPASHDFVLLPERFHLDAATSVLVYKRTREASPEVALQTRRQIDDYLSRSHGAEAVPPALPAASADGWIAASSPYPIQIVAMTGDSSTVKMAHPARVSQEPKTILALIDHKRDDVRISGDVGFYDPRCIGAQIVLASQVKSPKIEVAGVFTPTSASRHFDVIVPHVRANPVYMEIRSVPTAPENIDSCSLHIDNLTVRATGRPLSAEAARALRSDANPFVPL